MVDCFSNSESAEYGSYISTTHCVLVIVMPIRAELRGVITAASGCHNSLQRVNKAT